MKLYKFKFLALLICLLIFSSCNLTFFNKNIMEGDRNVLPRKYDMEENIPYSIYLKDIEFTNTFDAILVVDEMQKDALVITTDENIFESFDIKVDAENHSISVTGDKTRRYNPSEFEITVGGLVEYVEIAGAFVLDMKFTTVKNPVLNLTGALKGKIALNNSETLQLTAFGAAGVDFAGNVKNFNALISGAVNLKGYELTCETADITLSGAGLIELTVTSEIYADISGTAVFKYHGNAEIVKKDISGLGEIIQAEY